MKDHTIGNTNRENGNALTFMTYSQMSQYVSASICNKK